MPILLTVLLTQISLFTAITVHPESINTTLNSIVIFTCEAITDESTLELTFRVNNKPSNDADVIAKGFTVSTNETALPNGTTIRKGKLQAIAYNKNNNSNISCRASNDNSQLGFSYTSVLLIQG